MQRQWTHTREVATCSNPAGTGIPPLEGGVVGTARGTLSMVVVRYLGGPWLFEQRVVAVATRSSGWWVLPLT